MARSRKPKTPSFEVPADVTSASQSGWVFRSDVEKGKGKTAAKSLYGDGPLRFAWVPFAFVCSTVLSLFPSHDHRSGRS
jgi:hypothetical protein